MESLLLISDQSKKDLQNWDVSRDREARQKISADLGYCRIEITIKYLDK